MNAYCRIQLKAWARGQRSPANRQKRPTNRTAHARSLCERGQNVKGGNVISRSGKTQLM